MRLAPVLKILLFTATAARAQAPAAATARTQVQDFVRQYIEASNKVDVTAALEMTSRRPEVSSVSMGEVTRGWEAIRAAADEMVGQEGTFRYSLGSMDVTLLGANHALVVAPAVVTVLDERQQQVQLKAALTLVLERSGSTWKVLHEHSSIKVD